MKVTTGIMSALAMMIGVSVMAVAQETHTSCCCDDAIKTTDYGYRMKYNEDGQFKIMQLTDLHYMHGNEKTTRSIQAVEQLIAYEHPDLIVVTGDLIDPPVEESLHRILAPLEASGVPYALTYGNHDGGEESRAIMASLANSSPNCVNQYFTNGRGGGNGVITLYDHKNDKMLRTIYLLDSHGKSTNERIEGFDHVHTDMINWYRDMSDMLADANGGKAVPALMFYHIPIPELKTAVKEGEICGRRTWGEVTPMLSNGLFLAALEQGDVDAMFFGHDHGNDYSVMWHDILLAYGRYTGCAERIAGLQPQGARVIVLNEGTNEFDTYIRLMDGTIEQNEQ